MDNLKGQDHSYNIPSQPPPVYPQQEGNQIPLSNYQVTPPGYPNQTYGYTTRPRWSNQRRCLIICGGLIVLKIVVILIILAIVLHWGKTRQCYDDGIQKVCNYN